MAIVWIRAILYAGTFVIAVSLGIRLVVYRDPLARLFGVAMFVYALTSAALLLMLSLITATGTVDKAIRNPLMTFVGVLQFVAVTALLCQFARLRSNGDI